jgi:type II secretory pathway predicted ATPase ExeA
MYERYYGLRERPFDLSPNPRFLFMSNKHREALTHLKYGVTGRPGLTVMTGEAGTGKTTLVRAALLTSNGSGANSGIVHLSNPTLTRSEFFEYLAAGFGFTAEARVSKTRFLRELECALASRGRDNAVLALIVDEAQSLPHELLEEVRLLTNVEAPSGHSLAVVLVGQPSWPLASTNRRCGS